MAAAALAVAIFSLVASFAFSLVTYRHARRSAFGSHVTAVGAPSIVHEPPVVWLTVRNVGPAPAQELEAELRVGGHPYRCRKPSPYIAGTVDGRETVQRERILSFGPIAPEHLVESPRSRALLPDAAIRFSYRDDFGRHRGRWPARQ